MKKVLSVKDLLKPITDELKRIDGEISKKQDEIAELAAEKSGLLTQMRELTGPIQSTKSVATNRNGGAKVSLKHCIEDLFKKSKSKLTIENVINKIIETGYKVNNADSFANSVYQTLRGMVRTEDLKYDKLKKEYYGS